MSTEYTRRVLMVVTAADRDAANQAALQFDPAGGSNTFTVGLSADGSAPATHYWASGVMREATYAAVSALIAAQFPDARLFVDAAADDAEAVLAELGLQRVELTTLEG